VEITACKRAYTAAPWSVRKQPLTFCLTLARRRSHLAWLLVNRIPSPLTGVDFLASPCVPSPVSAIRAPKLPLLPLWEKGVGGMRAKGAQECRTSLISPKNSTLESTLPQGKGQNISRMLRQSAQQITLRCAFRASPVRLGFGWRFCQCCLVQDLAIALPGGYGSLSARERSLPVEVQRERYTSPLPIPNPAPPDHAIHAGHAPGTPHVSPR